MKPGSIYLDNCVSSPMAPEVLDAMLPYFSEKFWFPGSFISTGESTNDALAGFSQIVAKSMGATPEEIHFTSGGTLANNIAIKGLAASLKRGHVIVSVVDYPDLLTNAAWLEKQGFEVSYLSADSKARIDLDQLKAELRPDTVLFMTTAVNHVVGTIQPLKEIHDILAGAGHKIYFHVDAGQAYGKMPLDVNDYGIDTMSVSAHKIHGPQGIGALYLRKGTKLGQIIHGVKRVDGLQTGGLSIALIAGFAKAVELGFADLDGSIKQLRELSDYLLARLKEKIEYIELNGAEGMGRAPHNINISIDYIEGEAITMMLDMHGITVATGSACASQGLKANYVLMAIGKNHVQSHGSMKFTINRYNTKAELDFAVEKLAEITAELRKRSPLYNAFKKQET
ncbi:MAG: cysteine desulfurase family protein [Candidatus Cloacimonadales bacterium]|nr:cysteine desulfurase [Candidatus Cloacimonadota bacterium]MDY0380901.1 cysteine desulfurase family protein [Candidatus Cloacimonadaceae bacterium]HCX60791.1 cysteine desulfurase [Candidatus Cloacimonas sp.]MCB5256648.1 cysteine desulfurase [Candidatus Cloacimonadota bacterium]MCB5277589.1 cysteine desulfurase [Candidatus Cloacimonadota bacterium]